MKSVFVTALAVSQLLATPLPSTQTIATPVPQSAYIEYYDQYESIRSEIVAFATYLCEEYGTGWGIDGGNIKKHAVYYAGASGAKCGRSDCPSQGAVNNDIVGYGSYSQLQKHLRGLSYGSVSHVHLSCCAFATYCQKAVISSLKWGAQCTSLMKNYYEDIRQGDGTWDYIRKYAKPGDLILRGKTGNYSHAMLYVGPYRAPDGTTFRYAIAHASWNTKNQDLYVKDVTNMKANNVYLVPLEAEIAKYGYTRNSDYLLIN